MNNIKAKYGLIIPRRFTDGYGVNMFAINKIPTNSLLITMDNGIAAIEEIKVAKQRGIQTLIMDHHIGGETFPDADCIIDPEAIAGTNDFYDYCGAGLAFKLAEYMIDKEEDIEYTKSLACIGTIADMVSLTSDNRRIVKEGLSLIQKGKCPIGLKSLINQMNLNIINSSNIAYSIAPAMNAPGRLIDEGGRYVAKAIMEKEIKKAEDLNAWIISQNTMRKKIVKETMENMSVNAGDKSIFVVDEIPAGLIGLIAGKLSETYAKPSFVMTKANGKLKGSSRTAGYNNVKQMLDSANKYLLKYGGHAGAAGFSLYEKDFNDFRKTLNSYDVKACEYEYLYDLDLEPLSAQKIREEMDLLEPFGKGIPEPLFRLKCHFSGEFWHKMGNGEHIRFDIPNNPLKIIAFNMAEQFMNDGCPKDICFYGSLSWNIFRNVKSVNFIVKDYEKM